MSSSTSSTSGLHGFSAHDFLRGVPPSAASRILEVEERTQEVASSLLNQQIATVSAIISSLPAEIVDIVGSYLTERTQPPSKPGANAKQPVPSQELSVDVRTYAFAASFFHPNQ